MLTPTNRHPARHRAQLITSDVSLMRGATPVLHHVDLTLTSSSRVAIVGENGRGKSTLLQVLAGVLVPDSGTVQRIGTIAVAEQEMTAADSRTVGQAVAEAIAEPLAALAALDAAALALADNTDRAEEQYTAALEHAEALDAWDAERRVQIALEALDTETDTTRLLADLSVGQRYRVRLACLLGADHDFLLLDEPTNHLDRSGLEFLTAQLRARSGGVVVVSHDRALLSDIAETIVDLDPTPDDRPRVYGNGYAGYREGRLAERERWEQDYDRQQAEHARLKDSLSAAEPARLGVETREGHQQAWARHPGRRACAERAPTPGSTRSPRRHRAGTASALPVPRTPHKNRRGSPQRRSRQRRRAVEPASVVLTLPPRPSRCDRSERCWQVHTTERGR